MFCPNILHLAYPSLKNIIIWFVSYKTSLLGSLICPQYDPGYKAAFLKAVGSLYLEKDAAEKGSGAPAPKTLLRSTVCAINCTCGCSHRRSRGFCVSVGWPLKGWKLAQSFKRRFLQPN